MPPASKSSIASCLTGSALGVSAPVPIVALARACRGAVVADLTRHLGHTLAEEVPWTWQSRPIKLIDGTTVSMPDTPENQQRFPQQGS